MHRRPSARRAAATAVLFALLAAAVLAVYALVVGLGRVVLDVPSDGDAPLVLPVLATLIVALALEPLRTWLEPLTSRLAGPGPDSPYDVLTRFAAQVEGAHALGEVAPRMAHILAAATRARSAQVWVVVDRRMRLAAAWPPGSEGDDRLTLDEGRLTATPPLSDGDLGVPVRQGSTALGALVVRQPPGDTVTPVERKLVGGLAAQAALVLRNVALTAALHDQLARSSARSAELAASRRRLLTAQDGERRRLERDIHDGAQQHLVALIVHLRLLQTLLSRSPEQVPTVLRALRLAVDRASATLDELGQGVYPATLTEHGVAAALTEAALASPLPVEVRHDDGPRWPVDVEAAVYFCCLEALQNAGKHAGAASVVVELWSRDGQAHFTVRDDGRGFDLDAVEGGSGLTGLRDRAETLGGRIEIASAPGCGSTVSGSVPLAADVDRRIVA